MRKIGLVKVRARLVTSAAVVAMSAGAAFAQSANISLPAQPLADSLTDLSRITGENILFQPGTVAGVRAQELKGHMTPQEAVRALIQGTGLRAGSDGRGGVIVQRESFQEPVPNYSPIENRYLQVAQAATQAPTPVQEMAAPIETVTVSSSRIQTSGFNAPTPTTVLSSAFIQNQAKDNIYNAITELPSMMGSTGGGAGTGGTTGGTNGTQSFNMYGLGTIRTLTLLDSQRFVPANVQGLTDLSEFPNLLVQRVDVVTGGASASWGSDAVAGVVNYITDKKFTGFKANVEAGLSTYGDDASATFQVAAGTGFANDKGHFEIAGEFSHEDGVSWGKNGCCSTASLPNGRTWFKGADGMFYPSAAATPAGFPNIVNALHVTPNNAAPYGLINSGPLMGIAFAPGGSTYQFNYGTGPTGIPGVANPATGAVLNCVASECINGSEDASILNSTTLQVPYTRGNLYSRLSYDITPDINIWVTLNLAQTGSSNVANPDSNRGTLAGVPANSFGQATQTSGIQCGNAAGGANAFLPAAINADCVRLGITNFQLGTLLQGQGPQVVNADRDNRRLVGGADGSLSVLGTDWTWNAYYEHGENDTHIHVFGMTLLPYFYAAVDSVINSNGVAVCRSAAAQAEGCVPINLFGAPFTQGQLNWIYGSDRYPSGASQISHQMQDVGDFAISGTPFKDWAGEVSIAAGATYRQEAYDVTGDPAGDGNTTVPGHAPIVACSDPLLNCVNGGNWYAGNFHDGLGNYHVLEAFVETNVPLLNLPEWGSVNLNLAGRHARYSTSGDANTWKVGATWDTPLDGLRLRALQSRDVRAPNLSELFAAPTASNSTVTDPWTGQGNVAVPTVALGNTALKPEKSINSQAGIVYQPSWFDGFSASVDYDRISLSGQIATVPIQTSINECFAGLTQYCSAILVAQGTTIQQNPQQWTGVNTIPFNSARTVTDSFNYEVSYRFNLPGWAGDALPGDFTFRALAANISKFISVSGLPGSVPVESAGTNDGSTPHWKGNFNQSYETDNWSLHITENWISVGVHNRNYVQCNIGSCPVTTDFANHPTVNDNHVPGIVYANIGGTIKLSLSTKAYFQIDNAFNKSPPIDYSTNNNNVFGACGCDGNPLLYDTVGRTMHVGIRIQD